MKRNKKAYVIGVICALGITTMLLGSCKRNDSDQKELSQNQNRQENLQQSEQASQIEPPLLQGQSSQAEPPLPPELSSQPPKESGQTDTRELLLLDTSDMFSNRDREAVYDEKKSVSILLEKDKINCASKSVQVEGSKAIITEEGTYILSGSLENGSIVIDAEDTDKIQLVLKDVTMNCNHSAAIYVKQADKVFVTLDKDSENTLTVAGEFEELDDNHIDGVIFSKADLTLNGNGSLKIDTPYGHGIVSKDDLVIIGGNYELNVGEQGISGKDSVRIAGGNFVITAREDGIYSENTEDITKGFVYIAGGNYELAATDDAIHAGAQLVVEGGNVHISECEEGLEGMSVDIQGGNIVLNSKDDGVNASVPDELEEAAEALEKKGCFIRIGGGNLQIVAGGDGIDANGSIYMTGGETYICAPVSNDNGGIDYDEEGIISGGVLVTAGYQGMTQGFGKGSTQNVITARLTQLQKSNTQVELKDTEGNVLVSMQPKVDYDFVMISCPELKVGSTYTLLTGTQSQKLQVSEQGLGGFMPFDMPGGPQGERPEDIIQKSDPKANNW